MILLPILFLLSAWRLSAYHQDAGNSCDFRLWIEPDIVAERSSGDATNNRDPAMEAILREISTCQHPVIIG
jgi:hypothetical protein